MPKNLSQDFKLSMAELHREVQSLRKENIQMRKEMDELRKLATSANDAAVNQRKKATRNAVLQGDKARMKELSAGATDLMEQELLRQVDEPPAFIPVNTVNPHLFQGMLDRFQAGEPMATQIKIHVQEEPTTKVHDLYSQLARNQQKLKADAEVAREVAAHRARLEHKQKLESDGMKLGIRSELWATPLDDF